MMTPKGLKVAGGGLYGRPARTGDVRAIRGLINANLSSGRLLDKPTVTLYEDIQEFVVAIGASGDEVIGCGALHVMWEDLAEIRTIAVAARSQQGQGAGGQLSRALLGRAGTLGVRRVFGTPVAADFFALYGFEPDQRGRH